MIQDPDTWLLLGGVDEETVRKINTRFSELELEIISLRTALAEAVEALESIKGCMGGDNPGENGWNDPYSVWGIAVKALAAARAVNP